MQLKVYFILMTIFLLLSSCGQKGDLYLPSTDKKVEEVKEKIPDNVEKFEQEETESIELDKIDAQNEQIQDK